MPRRAVQGAASSAAWQSLLDKPLFKEPHAAQSPTLAHLVRIFATRHADVWKVPDALAWLLRCGEYAAAAAMGGAAVEAAVPAAARDAMMPYGDARALAEVTYPEATENEYAFLDVAHYSDARPTLPPEQVAALQRGGGGGGEAAAAAHADELHALLEHLAGQGGAEQDGVRSCPSNAFTRQSCAPSRSQNVMASDYSRVVHSGVHHEAEKCRAGVRTCAECSHGRAVRSAPACAGECVRQ